MGYREWKRYYGFWLDSGESVDQGVTNTAITGSSVAAAIDAAANTAATIFTVTSNTTLNSTHYESIIFSTSATKTLTMPTPVGASGRSLEVLNLGAINTTIVAVNATSQLLAVFGDSAVNSIVLTQFAEGARLISNGAAWICTPTGGILSAQ